MSKDIIRNRVSKAEFKDEFSFIDYHIVASRTIIDEIYKAIQAIENKYPKKWEDKNDA